MQNQIASFYLNLSEWFENKGQGEQEFTNLITQCFSLPESEQERAYGFLSDAHYWILRERDKKLDELGNKLMQHFAQRLEEKMLEAQRNM